MKRKIVEFITNLNDGGAENLVKDYVRLIDKEKYEVSVVTIRNFTHTAVYKEISKNNVPIIPIYKHWNIIIRIWNKLFGRWYIPFKLNKILKKEKVDCIHAHLYVLKYLRKIANNLKNVGMLYTCHSIPERNFFGVNEIEFYSAKYLIKNNNLKLIALHEEMKNELNELFDVNNTVVIHNGIDFKRYLNIEESKIQIRAELGLPSDAFIVGHVGRFIALKNHEFLIDVFSKLKLQQPNAFLVLVGDGELKQYIQEKVDNKGLNDSVLILSNRTDVPRILKAMDVFVFPSIVEGLGIALIEAQVMGLRCIASKNVPEEAFLTNKTVILDLESTKEEWVQAILDNSRCSSYNRNINEYNMNLEIGKLEELYSIV